MGGCFRLPLILIIHLFYWDPTKNILSWSNSPVLLYGIKGTKQKEMGLLWWSIFLILYALTVLSMHTPSWCTRQKFQKWYSKWHMVNWNLTELTKKTTTNILHCCHVWRICVGACPKHGSWDVHIAWQDLCLSCCTVLFLHSRPSCSKQA